MLTKVVAITEASPATLDAGQMGSYGVGDLVKVLDNVDVVRSLQRGHGEWAEAMLPVGWLSEGGVISWRGGLGGCGGGMTHIHMIGCPWVGTNLLNDVRFIRGLTTDFGQSGQDPADLPRWRPQGTFSCATYIGVHVSYWLNADSCSIIFIFILTLILTVNTNNTNNFCSTTNSSNITSSTPPSKPSNPNIGGHLWHIMDIQPSSS